MGGLGGANSIASISYPFTLHCMVCGLSLTVLGRCKAFLRYMIGLSHVHSFDTQSAPRISRELFDPKSPNFTRTLQPHQI